jgi:hypothetical protein
MGAAAATAQCAGITTSLGHVAAYLPRSACLVRWFAARAIPMAMTAADPAKQKPAQGGLLLIGAI